MNKMLEKLRDIDPRFVPFIIAGAIGLVVALDVFLFLRPQIAGLQALTEKAVKITKDIEDLKTNKQRVVQFQKQLDLARKEVDDFNAMVHSKDDIAGVLKSISSLANEYDVKIDQMLPQSPEVKPVVENADGKYFGQTIFIRSASGFHQFARFLNRLEKEKVFWKIDEFLISGDPQNPQRHEIRASVKILTLQK